jgi:tetratricopeptide (TPR) repeat protein
LDKVASAGCSTDAECARNFTWVAQEEESRGNPVKALAFYKRAYSQTPDDDDLLEDIARLTSAAGLHAEAADAYERLVRKHPADDRWRQAATIERDSAIRDTGPL